MGRELSDAVVFFHEAVAAHLGMTAAEWKCLGLLREHGSSSASRLAELSGFTTGAITGIVDRLERAGYVRREPHLTDRRSVIVQPQHLKEVQQRAIRKTLIFPADSFSICGCASATPSGSWQAVCGRQRILSTIVGLEGFFSVLFRRFAGRNETRCRADPSTIATSMSVEEVLFHRDHSSRWHVLSICRNNSPWARSCSRTERGRPRQVKVGFSP